MGIRKARWESSWRDWDINHCRGTLGSMPTLPLIITRRRRGPLPPLHPRFTFLL